MRLLPFEYPVRNLMRSPTRFMLAVTGSTLVVMLVVAAGAFVTGMRRSLIVAGAENNVLLVGAGSEESVERSEIGAGTASVVAASVAGIRARHGVAYVSPEVHLGLDVRTAADAASGELTVIRGVEPQAFLVHPQVRVVRGRMPDAGGDGVLIGSLVPSKLRDGSIDIGSRLWIDDREWTVAGVFSAPNSVMDGEIWMPLNDLRVIAQRDSLSCVVMTMDSPEGIDDMEVFAATRLDLELAAMGEAEYYSKLAEFFKPVRLMVVATSAMIALGAMLGGLNTMYASYASRVREIGTLQVLGFRRPAIVVSMIQESLLITSVGGLLGCAIGVLLFDGVAIRFSMGAFGLIVDGPVIALGLAAAVALGLVGTLPPVIRCLALPMTEALKS